MNLFFFDSLAQNLMLLFAYGILIIYLIIFMRHKSKVIIQKKHTSYEKVVKLVANLTIIGLIGWLGWSFEQIGSVILLGILFIAVVNIGLLSYGLTDQGIQYTGEIGSIRLIQYSHINQVILEEHDDFLRLKFKSTFNWTRRLDFPLSKKGDIVQLLNSKNVNIELS